MCGQHCSESFFATAVDTNTEVAACNNGSARFHLGKQWPALRQAAEKTWDLCDQSSLASSMVDVARIAELEGVQEGDESIAPIKFRQANFRDVLCDQGVYGGEQCTD